MPTKRVITSIEFVDEEGNTREVFCALRASMKGKKEEDLTDEQKKEHMTNTCDHPVWPSFLPQCIGCIANNEHQRYFKDKQGRKNRIVK